MVELISIIIVGIIVLVFLFLNSKTKKRSSYGTKGMFSDAWKKIDGEDISHRYAALNTLDDHTARYPTNQADNIVSDMLARIVRSRRGYYREVYLKSAAWQRKRYLVLKRDNWTCLHCGRPANQVHHKKYARAIGKEPIDWLESVCKICHENLH